MVTWNEVMEEKDKQRKLERTLVAKDKNEFTWTILSDDDFYYYKQ